MTMPDKRNFYNLPSDARSLASKNGNGHKLLAARKLEPNRVEQREVNLKFATFYLVVALALIFADALGRIGKPAGSPLDRYLMGDVTLAIHPGLYNKTRMGLAVPFRLSNEGKRAVFYPVRPGTDVPVGHILVRNSSSSEWTNQSGAPDGQAPEVVDSRVSWIELPPGGWIDSEFDDRIESPGDHAYAVFLKPDRDGSSIRIISEPYRSDRE